VKGTIYLTPKHSTSWATVIQMVKNFLTLWNTKFHHYHH